ncbi:MAG: outer membrane beta-barrel protein [Longimicrobiales bacterium]|nr:outer membrane beta-barrel protein [Longimicrobiales bacterium]
MYRVRITLLTVAAALALAFLPGAADAQLRFGAHVARAQDLPGFDAAGGDDGSFGIGARVGIDPPLIPLAFYGTFDYFFPDCGSLDCDYQNFAIDTNFTFLPLLLLDLYATGGITFRRFELEDESDTATGFSLGGGVSFNFLVNAYLEARNEFFDGDDGGDQLLIRLGVLF